MVSSTVTLERTCSFRGEFVQHLILSPRETKKHHHTPCNHSKCELVGFDALPNFLRDNEFILNYYRSEWPWKQSILSIFGVHNETLNIWTHLIGFFIFFALTLCAFAVVPLAPQQGSNNLSSLVGLPSSEMLTSSASSLLTRVLANHTDAHLMDLAQEEMRNTAEITRWPFYAYLFGAMFCLFTSSACHLLSCHSERCAYTMLRLDYTGISILIVTSFYPLVYYTFMCEPFFRNLYIGFITTFGVATVLVSLVPVFQTPEFRSVRALLFFCMGVSGLVPIVHKLIAFGHQPQAVITAGYELLMGAFYGLGVVVYAARVPERWMPGKFDLVGHSHQLFHVLVIAGAYTHYLASVMYLSWREMEGC